MQQVKHTILSTRNISSRLIAKATEHGLSIEVKEFISVKLLQSAALEKEIHDAFGRSETAFIFTSRNAAAAVGNYFTKPAVPAETAGVYCLENGTLAAVKKNLSGAKIKGVAANASSLADLILEEKIIRSAVFFCGNKRRDILPEKLRDAGIPLREIVVYETVETPSVAAGSYQGIFFFSPSSVNSFFSVNRPEPETLCFAIGETTAAALKEKAVNRILKSDRQSAEGLIDMAIAYFQQINRQG